MQTENQKIAQFIPQRPPFVMIDTLVDTFENGIRSSFKISADNCLVANGIFQESGLVENMAQTAALFAGHLALQTDKPTPVGYIGALKNLKILNLPRVNETVHTFITLKSEVINIQIVEAQVHNEADELLAECELRIFIKPD